MNFITINFVLFFLPVLCIGWMLRSRPTVYQYFLLLAGLFFYAQAGLGYVGLLVGVAALNWGSVKLMACLPQESGKRKLIVAGDVILHILLLAFFKYTETLFTWLNNLAGEGTTMQRWLIESGLGEVVLPAGLSFYSFMGLSYLVDHYRHPEQKPRSFVDVLSYVSFFPTLLAGPIMRSHEFFPQLQRTKADNSDFHEGLAMILSGLFKKVVLATYLSQHLVDPVFQDPQSYSTAAVLMAVYAYTGQIFCDFSGYTDMAIGIGRLMGFRLPQNFNSPYRSLNLQEFWHRWHITLSQWLRDYLYIPMGGSRRGNRYVNLTATMVIGGIWHGNSLAFLIWGFFHGVGLVIVHGFHRLRDRFFPHAEPKNRFGKFILQLLAWLLTIHTISFLWIFFRAENFDAASQVIQSLAWGREGYGFEPLIIIILALVLALQWYGHYLYTGFTKLQSILPWPLQALIVGLLGGLILNMGPEGMLPFIYFNF